MFGLMLVSDPDDYHGGAPLGVILIMLGVVTPFVFNAIISGKEKDKKDKALRQVQLLKEYYDETQTMILEICGEGRMLAMCREHDLLIRPEVCLLSITGKHLEIVALRIDGEKNAIDEISACGLSDACSDLRISASFDDIIRIEKKRPETTETVSPGKDDRLSRAVVGGVLAGEAGAVVGALTGTNKGPERRVVQNADAGGVYDRMSEGRETLIQLRDGGVIVLDGIEDRIQNPFVPVHPSRDLVDGFVEKLRSAIAEHRRG